MTDYDNFTAEIEESANKIVLKKAITTERHGTAGLRDRIVFGKYAWAEALAYMAIVQSAVVFLGLIDDVIINVNSALWDLGSVLGIEQPFQFPVNIASYAAICFIVFIFCFGLIAVRHIGTSKRSYELSSKMNAGNFTTWRKLDDIQQTQKVIIERLDKLESR